MPPAVEAPSLNHWTAREVPWELLLISSSNSSPIHLPPSYKADRVCFTTRAPYSEGLHIWGLLFWDHILEMLSHFIFERVFCTRSVLGQWCMCPPPLDRFSASCCSLPAGALGLPGISPLIPSSDTCRPVPLVEAWSREGQGQAWYPAVPWGLGYGSGRPTWAGSTAALFSG